MKKLQLLFLSIIFVCAANQVSFASSTAHTYGFSAKGIAMGNAMCAIVEDWSAVFYNISGLGKTAHLKKGDPSTNHKLMLSKGAKDDFLQNQFTLGYIYTMPLLYLNIDRKNTNGEPRSTNAAEDLNYGALVVGVAFDLNTFYKMPSFISSIRFGLGIITNDDGTVVKINDDSPKTHNFLRYGRNSQRAVILAGIGMGFMNDAFGFGVGTNLSFAGKGKVKITEVDISSEKQTPEGESRMDLSIDPSLVAGIYINPGKIIGASIIRGLEIGFAYRQESQLEIYPFETVAVATGDIPLEMVLALYDYYTPPTYIAGIAYSAAGLTLSFEGEYQAWSKFSVSTPNNMHYPDMPEMKDIIIPKVGISYQALNWLTIMTGYFYQESFVPDEANTGEYNFLENDKHVGSFGLMFLIPKSGNMGGALEINVSYQFQYLVPRTVAKDDQTNTLNPDYDYGGKVHTVMLNVMMRM